MQNAAGEDEEVEDSVIMRNARPRKEHDAERVRNAARDRQRYRSGP